MSADKRVLKYFENRPYGDAAKSSEIHGEYNKHIVNGMITNLAKRYNESMAEGDKNMAQNFKGAIKQIAQDLDNLKEIKKA